eukprot:NODE_353_length_1746_cov_310.516794_g286_i0.p1 GENE.NODE_353_length_1746_cov_310.516794_g286_i0~~NODE_353_length_1746_cov_310.516794_g286_i0.p1  ORF type:complete len:440 (-),score=135.52 NODE_353_length_1746_cov_310.516794_g286_i0:291-1610(-)
MSKWAVIACDQYSSEPEHWEKVQQFVGDSPSALRLVLPEVYLDTPKEQEIHDNITKVMSEYHASNIFEEQPEGFILVDRKTPEAESRRGLVVAMDLEHYDYNKGAHTLVRATEGTIVARLPPRMRIRKDAAVELPHIMVLIDDPECTVIEPLFEYAQKEAGSDVAKDKDEKLPLAYDFTLMNDCGHLRGWKVQSPAHIERVADALQKLADPTTFAAKYGVTGQDVLLFAMGDGNHSLATAKAHWERIKEEAPGGAASVVNHPARHALVELVNIHDKGLAFESIHRVLFNVDRSHLCSAMEKYYTTGYTFESASSAEEAHALAAKLREEGAHAMAVVWGGGAAVACIRSATHANLVVGTLQPFLDGYLASNPGIKIDYIHGLDVTTRLAQASGNIGFFLPDFHKSDLFQSVVLDGALPRKTFSMGAAAEKRFYVEARAIQ